MRPGKFLECCLEKVHKPWGLGIVWIQVEWCGVSVKNEEKTVNEDKLYSGKNVFVFSYINSFVRLCVC